MKTRTLLALVFGFILVINVARAAASIHSFDALVTQYDAQAKSSDAAEASINTVAAIAVDLETGLRGWLLTGERRFLDPYDRATRGRPAATDGLVQVEAGKPAEASARELRDRLDAWDREVARRFLAADVNKMSASEKLALHDDGKARMDTIRGNLDRLRALLVAQRDLEAKALAAYQSRLVVDLVVVASIIALALITLGLIMVRAVERPLSNLVAYAETTATREGVATPPVIAGVSEARVLARALVAMVERLAIERAREKRFTRLVSDLSAGGDVPTVAEVALRSLVDEHGAVGGVLWVDRDRDGVLSVAASSAVDRTALPANGSPLALEAHQSKRTTRIADLGVDATHVVRSALIDAVPRSLLVAPIIAGKETVGVVELAGLTVDAEGEAEVTRALSRVGLALQNAVTLTKLDTMRQELAGMNAELHAQNEELRAQEEELRAQSEEVIAKQSELTETNTALVKASRMKTDFLSTMSHELRTPLNAVIGFADVLRARSHGPLSSTQLDYVEQIAGAGQHLLTLVNDILDLSKIEAGRIELRWSKVDLAEAAHAACALATPLASRKRIKLESRLEGTKFLCRADAERVRQVFLNLVSNAIKFTPEGGSVVIAAEADADVVRVSVIDTGVGIADSEATRLFQPFTQLGSGHAQRAGGTGLGLSICRRVVELMGGEIGFTSKVGKGSTFFFSLPLAKSDSLPARAPEADAPRRELPRISSPPGVRPRILVVEDDERSGRLAEDVLAREGYDVRLVQTAEKALLELDGPRPSLLIVDLGLPGMSGLAFVERVRARRDGVQRVPILILTARDLAESERLTLARSADLIAQKGMMTGVGFLDAVHALATRGRQELDASEPEPATSGHVPVARDVTPPRLRILVIDDSQMNRRVVRAMLEPAGCDVDEADGAVAGIAVAVERSPDVILMDICMPDVDGLEATRTLRARAETSKIPVVALTAQAMPGDRERALEAGCVAYLTKPVAREELTTTVRRVANEAAAQHAGGEATGGTFASA